MIDGHHVIAAGDSGVPWSTSTEVVPAHMRLAMKHRMTKLDVRALKRLVSGTADHALVTASKGTTRYTLKRPLVSIPYPCSRTSVNNHYEMDGETPCSALASDTHLKSDRPCTRYSSRLST
jgi:hypothetical protein